METVDIDLDNEESINILGKCGEIFLQRRQKKELFVFLCTLCEEKYTHLDIFTKHIKEIHLVDEQEETTQPMENNLNISIISYDDLPEETVENDGAVKIEEEFNINQENCGQDNLDPYSTLQTTTTPNSDEESQSSLNCLCCSQKFSFFRQLQQHLCPRRANDTRIKLFQCAKCLKCFKRKSNLKTHELTHQSVKPFACDQCSLTFANKQNLVVHVRRHAGEKPFKCTYCEKAFVSSTERNSHERSHTGMRPYICEECGKGHATSSQLLEHRRRHTDERRFECGECQKRFRTSSHLRNHQTLVHANLPRNHYCAHCSAGFKTSLALQQHEKIHAKVKRYQCQLCPKQFAQHPGLYAHMKTHKSYHTYCKD